MFLGPDKAMDDNGSMDPKLCCVSQTSFEIPFVSSMFSELLILYGNIVLNTYCNVVLCSFLYERI
jgi:hypothetical protein